MSYIVHQNCEYKEPDVPPEASVYIECDNKLNTVVFWYKVCVLKNFQIPDTEEGLRVRKYIRIAKTLFSFNNIFRRTEINEIVLNLPSETIYGQLVGEINKFSKIFDEKILNGNS